MTFPAESEPDGDRFLLHHWWIGIFMMIGGFMQWSAAGPPEAGAALAGLGLLVALDDYLSHSLGIWTPLDAVHKLAIRWYYGGR